ncbi:MAG: hypothetical protein ABIO76_13375, partial [Ginsengibacter sp.]
MKKISVIFVIVLALNFNADAQYEYVQEGEVGITAGVAHYFGDINNRAAFNRPKVALGIFLRKQFSNYTALRVAAHYARLGYSDQYSENEFQ